MIFNLNNNNFQEAIGVDAGEEYVLYRIIENATKNTEKIKKDDNEKFHCKQLPYNVTLDKPKSNMYVNPDNLFFGKRK